VFDHVGKLPRNVPTPGTDERSRGLVRRGGGVCEVELAERVRRQDESKVERKPARRRVFRGARPKNHSRVTEHAQPFLGLPLARPLGGAASPVRNVPDLGVVDPKRLTAGVDEPNEAEEQGTSSDGREQDVRADEWPRRDSAAYLGESVLDVIRLGRA
jgi:hypothetical protein